MNKKWIKITAISALVLALILLINRNPPSESDFTGPVIPGEPIPEKLVMELEAYVRSTMRENEVPGVSMVLVQGDRVLYSGGIGVRDLETREPVRTDTLMVIGSSTKTMTAVMIGTMVDQGLLDWDTPVRDIWPEFALSDPEISQKLTIRHTLCMCTGVPRRMEEISFRFSELSPEKIIASLADIPLQGTFERKFAYSTRMLAAGGYLAAIAQGAEYGRLEQGYAEAMQTRIFDPLGMAASTFSVPEAVASGNYATPHYTGLSGYEAIPVELEEVFRPIAPGGALWSTADDLGKYLLMLLNGGATPDGRRLISAETLAYLWEPGVYIDSQNQYGLGWHIEDYHGHRVVHHPGGTVGFSAELVVIPEYGIGFALLANRLDMVSPIGRMATYRLLEMLTGSEQTYHAQIGETSGEIAGQVRTLSLLTQKSVDREALSPYLGAYENETLGRVELVLHEDNSLWLDVGEYDIPLRKLRLEENQYILYESLFVGKTLVLKTGADGQPSMVLTGDEAVYTFGMETESQFK